MRAILPLDWKMYNFYRNPCDIDFIYVIAEPGDFECGRAG